MRSRIAGDAWQDDDEPTISIVVTPDETSEPRLEVGEEDFIRAEPPANDWRIASDWAPPEVETIPRPPKVPRIARIAPADRLPTDRPARAGTDHVSTRRPRHQGQRPMPPEPKLPKFSTNTNAGLAHSTPAPPAPVFELPGSRSIPTEPPSRRNRSDRAPIAQPVIAAVSTQPLDSPAAPPMMTPSAPPVQPAPVMPSQDGSQR